MDEKAPRKGRTLWADPRLAILIALTLLLGLLVILHVPGINGPSFWRWQWRDLDPLRVYPILLLASVFFFLAQWLRERRKGSAALPLALLMVGMFATEIAAIGVASDPFDLGRIGDIIRHPGSTSYFTDAKSCTEVGPWLDTYHSRMSKLHLHSAYKPPGPILFHVFLQRLFPEEAAAAMAGGIAIGLLATLAVPLTYLLISSLLGDRSAAFYGAAFLSICPGPIVFFPQFDQIYPILSTALLLLWALSLERNSWRHSAAFGIVLGVLCFFSYGLLVIGAILTLYAVRFVWEDPKEKADTVARHAAIGLGVFVGAYLLLWWWTGFDAIRSFLNGLEYHARFARYLDRPYPLTIFWDLADFGLGTGWLAYLLTAYFLLRRRTRGEEVAAGGRGRRVSERWAVGLVLAQIGIVAVSGLLKTETSRTWIFLMPLLAIPVGLELARWGPVARNVAYGCFWFLLAAICQNLVFLG